MQQSVMSEDQIDAWRAAIRRATFANCYYEMGIAIRRDGDGASAIHHFRQARDIQPDHWRAAYGLAEALRDGRWSSAPILARRRKSSCRPLILSYADGRPNTPTSTPSPTSCG
ncbi:hypothetical protein C1S70_30320 (plasmid) [Azospirillum argentinense]|uniref:Uncharacterized protein n=1 Tax=Azospirillum argentinense TaxID=2970906 RepID=A0A2K1FRN4_9PROT|nr:hypothetical protein [Azospirillum argentinense]PNQ95185.1 hypothetical protein C1S70_30320 [Azospirillum argentinense]